MSKNQQDSSLTTAQDYDYEIEIMVHRDKGSKMKTLKPEVLGVTVIVVIFSFLFWFAWLFVSYVADDWTSPPADERSIPATKSN